MVIGTKNEYSILSAFSMNYYVEQVFECGLLECLNFPWLAASPDAVAVLNVSGRQIIATVEIRLKYCLKELL
jgi:hypothetical protein